MPTTNKSIPCLLKSSAINHDFGVALRLQTRRTCGVEIKIILEGKNMPTYDTNNLVKLGALQALAQRTKNELTAIDTKFASAFRSMSVSGNTVSFFTSTDASGTAASKSTLTRFKPTFTTPARSLSAPRPSPAPAMIYISTACGSLKVLRFGRTTSRRRPRVTTIDWRVSS